VIPGRTSDTVVEIGYCNLIGSLKCKHPVEEPGVVKSDVADDDGPCLEMLASGTLHC
jgi:hypothetical protein